MPRPLFQKTTNVHPWLVRIWIVVCLFVLLAGLWYNNQRMQFIHAQYSGDPATSETIMAKIESVESLNQELQERIYALHRTLNMPLPRTFAFVAYSELVAEMRTPKDDSYTVMTTMKLRPGMFALEKNRYLGRVLELGGKTVLISARDQSSKLPITIANQVHAILEGQGAEQAAITLPIADYHKVKEGDEVTTRSTKSFPGGLIVGQVKRVERNRNDRSIQILVQINNLPSYSALFQLRKT